MIRIESSWSVFPQAPNIIVPRHSFETWTPVRPSGRYSMAPPQELSTTFGYVCGLSSAGFGPPRTPLSSASMAGPGHVDEHAAEWRPRLGLDAQRIVGLAQGGLREVGMHLDLVDRRHDMGAVDQDVQELRAEVRDADGARPPFGEHLLGGLVRADRRFEVGRHRLVEQVEVDVVEPEAAEAGVEADQGG